MNKSFLIPLGIVVFALSLAIALRDSLSGDAALIAVGVAIGLAVGVPAGMLAMGAANRRSQPAQPPVVQPGGVTLSPEQTELLLKAIERQQASPASFGVTSREARTFTSVGGASVADLPGDAQDRN